MTPNHPTPLVANLREVRRVIALVASKYGVPPAAITGRDRHRTIAAARRLAYWLARAEFGYSYPELGLSFGRDHTTIMHGCRVVERQQLEDAAFAALVRGLRSRVQNVPGLSRCVSETLQCSGAA